MKQIIDCFYSYFDPKRQWSNNGPFESDPDLLTAKKRLAELANLDARSVGRWIGKNRRPTGFRLFVVGYFLWQRGLRPQEIEELDQSVYRLGEKIIKEKIDIAEIYEAFGFEDLACFQSMFIGKYAPNAENLKKIADFLGEYTPVNTKSEKADSKLKPAEKIIIDGGDVSLIKSLNNLIDALNPRLDRLLNQESPESRRLFREEIGSREFFDISNKFSRCSKKINALCSEEARKIILAKADKEAK